MKTTRTLITVSALASLLMVGCQSTQPVANISAQPLAAPEPLPAWIKASDADIADENVRQVRIEMKIIELNYPAGEKGIPTRRYENRMTESERQEYISLLEQRGGMDLLSMPTVVTREGQMAQIEVGDKFQYSVEPQSDSDSTEVTLGVSSHVRAKPAADGKTLALDVLAEVKELVGYHQDESGIKRPVIDTRRLGTSVNLPVGETIVFGGLISDAQQEVVDKVPLLGDIPILGHLFKSHQTMRFKRELIVMATPTMIGNVEN